MTSHLHVCPPNDHKYEQPKSKNNCTYWTNIYWNEANWNRFVCIKSSLSFAWTLNRSDWLWACEIGLFCEAASSMVCLLMPALLPACMLDMFASFPHQFSCMRDCLQSNLLEVQRMIILLLFSVVTNPSLCVQNEIKFLLSSTESVMRKPYEF